MVHTAYITLMKILKGDGIYFLQCLFYTIYPMYFSDVLTVRRFLFNMHDITGAEIFTIGCSDSIEFEGQ